MADYTPLMTPGSAWTSTASAQVTGGQVVAVTGDSTTAPTSATGVQAVGVAGHDAPAGGRVTIHGLAGVMHILTTSAAVTAGQTLRGAAGGTVVPWVTGTDPADTVIAVALSSAASGAGVRCIGIR